MDHGCHASSSCLKLAFPSMPLPPPLPASPNHGLPACHGMPCLVLALAPSPPVPPPGEPSSLPSFLLPPSCLNFGTRQGQRFWAGEGRTFWHGGDMLHFYLKHAECMCFHFPYNMAAACNMAHCAGSSSSSCFLKTLDHVSHLQQPTCNLIIPQPVYVCMYVSPPLPLPLPPLS